MTSRKGIAISYEERIVIYQGLKKHESIKNISKLLNRCANAVKRELSFGGGYYYYDIKKAQELADLRLKKHNEARAENSNFALKAKENKRWENIYLENEIESDDSSKYRRMLESNEKRKIVNQSQEIINSLKELMNRVSNLEFQIEILTDTIKEIKNYDKKDQNP